MSDSVQPHRWQPTRPLCPWDSPSKNTGVGCHFLFQCIKVKSESEVTQSCPTLRDPMGCSLLGSCIHRIFQANVLEWVAIYRHIWFTSFILFFFPLVLIFCDTISFICFLYPCACIIDILIHCPKSTHIP